MEQINIFGESKVDECCRRCRHFAEFKEPRTYTDRDGEFSVFGMCFVGFAKNGSFYLYPVYIADGKCKRFERG